MKRENRNQRRSRRIREVKNSMINLVDAIWDSGLANQPEINKALMEAQKQLDISEGTIKNEI